MNQSDQAKNYILGAAAIFGTLFVFGLVLALSASPGESNRGKESGLVFNDDNDPSYGPGESKKIVRIFSDFQCPACAAAEPGLRRAMKTYGDQVRFVWNDFPLSSIHKNARIASVAGRCADEQGKFWEYSDILFKKQAEWSEVNSPTLFFTGYAETLRLDKTAFTSCLVNQPSLSKIKDDENEGKRNRVQGTPTFFIGDYRYLGGMEDSVWDQAIQNLIQGK